MHVRAVSAYSNILPWVQQLLHKLGTRSCCWFDQEKSCKGPLPKCIQVAQGVPRHQLSYPVGREACEHFHHGGAGGILWHDQASPGLMFPPPCPSTYSPPGTPKQLQHAAACCKPPLQGVIPFQSLLKLRGACPVNGWEQGMFNARSIGAGWGYSQLPKAAKAW